MPSQTLTTQEIKEHYGVITDFIPPFFDHPVSHGLHGGQGHIKGLNQLNVLPLGLNILAIQEWNQILITCQSLRLS